MIELDWTQPYYLLGEGSNTVFLGDFSGQIIHVANKGIKVLESEEEFVLTVAAGENWHKFVVYCLDNGIFGLENLALIPGTVGAAPVQNIGAYGLEVKDVISEVRGFNVRTGKFENLSANQCEFAYRDSIFKGPLNNKFVITEVVFKLPKKWQANLSYGLLKELGSPTAKQVFDEVVRIRQSKLPDPKVEPNAGSFFKNPVITKEQANKLLVQYPNMPNYVVDAQHTKLAAGWLIEKAGLKGYQHGGICVSPKQALVLINKESGSRDDLLELIKLIQTRVNQQFNIKLEHEVRLIGKTCEIKVEAD